MTPVLSFVTPGTLIPGSSFGDLADRIAVAASSGIHLIQVRERALEAAELVRLVEACVGAVRGSRARVLVNDRLDVALAAGAHGVHLRARSIPASRVRTIAPRGFIVGRSIHSAAEARTAECAEGVDYFLFGTVFPSRSKPGRAPAGLPALAAAVEATTVPVLAIGGVTIANAGQLKASGAAGAAAIGLFAQPSLDRLQVVVDQMALAFDTPGGVT